MAYDIIFQVLLVLAAAVFTGELFEQVGFPSVAGELFSGIILGPTFLGLVVANAQTQAISSIALFFVVFLIGFEMTTSTVGKQLAPAAVISATSFALPFAATAVVASLVLPFGFGPDVIVALGISVPSISIISILVMELGLMDKRAGQLVIASVTVTDISAFLVLAALTGSSATTYYVLGGTAVFVACFIGLDWWLNSHPGGLQRVMDRGSAVMKREDFPFALLLILALTVAVILQAIGISFIIGAFLAGLMVHDGLIGRRPFRKIADSITLMNRAFFIPLFFGFAGTETAFGPSYYYLLPLLLVLLLVSVTPATSVTYLAAGSILKERQGARQVAFLLAGRGAVGIVVVSLALGEGVINNAAYSMVVLGTLVVSVLVPVIGGKRELD